MLMLIRVLVLVMFSHSMASNAAAKEYTFSIVPQQSSKKLAKLWGPVLKKISEDTGITLKFATAKDIPTFEKRLLDGQYDFAYMNPYHFTVYNDVPGYIALAHQSEKRITGIMVVRKDSDITAMMQLNGETLAFPSPAAFAATILPTAELNNMGIDYSTKFVSSHDSVYLAVAKGLFPAGGGIVRTFNNTNPEIREQLKVLWSSNGYTPHAFAAHPKVDSVDRSKVARALTSLQDTQEGRALLKSLNFNGIQLAADIDWDDVRELKITELDEK